MRCLIEEQVQVSGSEVYEDSMKKKLKTEEVDIVILEKASTWEPVHKLVVL